MKVTDLLSVAAAFLAVVSAGTPITCTPIITIISEDTRRRFRTSSIDTCPISRTVAVVNTGFTTDTGVTHAIANAGVIIFTRGWLDALATNQIADKPAGALFIGLTTYDALLLVVTGASSVTVCVDLTIRPFRAATVVSADSSAWTFEVVLTWISTETTRTDPRAQAICVSETLRRLLTRPAVVITDLITRARRLLAARDTFTVYADLSVATVAPIATASHAATVSVVGALQTTITLFIINTRCLTCAQLTDSETNAVDVTGALCWLLASSRGQITGLSSKAAIQLTRISAHAATTDSAIVTVFAESAGVSLRTAPLDAETITTTIKVIQTWLDAGTCFTDAVANTCIIGVAHVGLDAQTTITAHLRSWTFSVLLTTVDASLVVIVTDPPRITVHISLAAWPFSAPPVIAAHPRTDTV